MDVLWTGAAGPVHEVFVMWMMPDPERAGHLTVQSAATTSIVIGNDTSACSEAVTAC